jgi:hypothetical protein
MKPHLAKPVDGKKQVLNFSVISFVCFLPSDNGKSLGLGAIQIIRNTFFSAFPTTNPYPTPDYLLISIKLLNELEIKYIIIYYNIFKAYKTFKIHFFDLPRPLE